MARASISVALGGILRRSDPVGRIYCWILSVDFLGSVTRVPYLVSLYMERNTEKLNALKSLRNPSKRHKNTSYISYTHNRTGKSIFLFFHPLFWTISYDRYIPKQTLLITLSVTQCHIDGLQRSLGYLGVKERRLQAVIVIDVH